MKNWRSCCRTTWLRRIVQRGRNCGWSLISMITISSASVSLIRGSTVNLVAKIMHSREPFGWKPLKWLATRCSPVLHIAITMYLGRNSGTYYCTSRSIKRFGAASNRWTIIRMQESRKKNFLMLGHTLKSGALIWKTPILHGQVLIEMVRAVFTSKNLPTMLSSSRLIRTRTRHLTLKRLRTFKSESLVTQRESS